MTEQESIKPDSVEYGTPVNFRLKRITNPLAAFIGGSDEYVLQGAYKWESLDGSEGGIVWRDIPTVVERQT